ncbi:hypothetical protein ZIOFF_017411 [Zingiber officinale]|uniref:RING-CH-type domain-containing protein n=1 Tax=Zingiber officinale TaxID=94328 RepID=A0A8J5LA76_ZINOF|nr:hypothetical protein ZIOFF_017411 [Zingiber officinale]
MGEFMVCIDRLVGSESCIVPANGVVNGGFGGASPGEGEGGRAAVVVGCPGNINRSSRGKKKKDKEVGGRVVVECRICQEEGEEEDMEIPCACNGTLKFAHRKCIQRWCDKKGNITCEICNQAFGPNYTAPPIRPSSDVLAIDISSALEFLGISHVFQHSHAVNVGLNSYIENGLHINLVVDRPGFHVRYNADRMPGDDWDTLIDLRDPHFLAIAAAQQDLLNDYEDYATENANGIACCRVITLILMLLLLLRNILVVMKNIEMVQDISTLFNVNNFGVCWLFLTLLCNSPLLLSNTKLEEVADLTIDFHHEAFHPTVTRQLAKELAWLCVFRNSSALHRDRTPKVVLLK